MKKILFVPILVLLAIFYSLLALDRIELPVYISRSEIRKTVAATADSIEQKYVFPAMGHKLATALRVNLGKGDLYVMSPRKLENKMNLILTQVSHDKHLRIHFNPRYARDLQDGGQTLTDSVMLSQDRQHDFYFFPVRQFPGGVGYLRMDMLVEPLHAGDKLARVFDSLKESKALIVDLRQNQGGDPEMVQQFISRFYAPTQTVHLNDMYSRLTGDTTRYWTIPNMGGTHFPDQPLYVLISNRTFSAAEELAYDLQALHRAVIVGEASGGGANAGDNLPVGKRFVIFVPNSRAINPYTKSNWENTGVRPDFQTNPDHALDAALQMARTQLKKGS